MILLIGSAGDPVVRRVSDEIRCMGVRHAIVDEDQPRAYELRQEGGLARIHGRGCSGQRQVGAVFVRHTVARSLLPTSVQPLIALQQSLNRILGETDCLVVNRPFNATSNYSKPYQLRLLARAGFDTPRTLVTNVPGEATRFIKELEGQVIIKGVSNRMTFARRVNSDDIRRFPLICNAPVQLQEYVVGDDYRVHVVGHEVFVTRLESRDEDYRRAAIHHTEEIIATPAQLPAEVTARCVEITRSLNLVVSGIDFKAHRDGRLVVLELNPYPQFTFYEGRTGQPITRAVADCLVRSRGDSESRIYV